MVMAGRLTKCGYSVTILYDRYARGRFAAGSLASAPPSAVRAATHATSQLSPRETRLSLSEV